MLRYIYQKYGAKMNIEVFLTEVSYGTIWHPGKIRMEPINCRLICKISFSHVTLRDGTVLQISEDRQKKSM